jgi:hypothetical protein
MEEIPIIPALKMINCVNCPLLTENLKISKLVEII